MCICGCNALCTRLLSTPRDSILPRLACICISRPESHLLAHFLWSWEGGESRVQEVYTQEDMFTKEKPQAERVEQLRRSAKRRRVETLPAEQSYDFSQVDFSQKDVLDSLRRAYRVLLSSRRRLQEKGNAE